MKVIRAASLGFCPGVRRAVTLAEDAARNAAALGRPVFVLGQIVHNPQVSAALEALGVRQISEDESVPAGSLVVIRSHGVPPSTKRRLEAGGAGLIDATCPRVMANQREAASFAGGGYTVVIAGDKGHGETASVAGNAPGSIIVSSPDEARSVHVAGKLALIAQTTLSDAEYDAIRDVLLGRYPGLVDARGICGATHERRAALEALCGLVEAVVVVGGKNSANTRRLAELARSKGLPTWQVESAAEITAEAAAYDVVGLSAGASTPDGDIDEVERRLMELAALVSGKSKGETTWK
jgi:4-hydroxy-3-methylbut-2-enyl diphosphate reductase